MTDYHIKTLDNAVLILDSLADDRPLGVSEIARQTKLSKTTVFRLLKALEMHHFVIQIDQNIYTLGYGMLRYKPIDVHNQALIKLAKPHMQTFTQMTGETINLAIHHDKQVYFIHTEAGETYLLQFSLAPTAKLYCSSMGKIFLSHMTDAEIQDYFKKDLKARTLNTITDYAHYQIDKKAILTTGIAYDQEEYEYGLTCLATGLYQNKQLIAAIGCSGPTSRLKIKGYDFLEKQLKETAQRINDLLN
ncbi:IclR family transcriptional regulator [Streptococcus halichoeri]|uniref:IclR family transcriptional regulator n=1 Tax=Streptococcus halichoeri TaxID=254785 RepID=UPI001359C246|nr:IclR family transcriptional regulator [Streptococcus halichoeri]